MNSIASTVPIPVEEDLEDMRARITSLKETIESFVLTPEMQWPDMLDKLNVLHVRLQAVQQTVRQSQKWKSCLVEPYALLSRAELVPQVYLRTRWLPELEEQSKEHMKNKFDKDSIDRYESLVESCRSTLEDLQAEHRFNQRYQTESTKETDFAKLAKDEESLLCSIVHFVKTGSIKQQQ